MANANMSIADVKAICNELECSPEAQFSDSPYGGKASISRGMTAGQTAGKGRGGSAGATLGLKSLKSSKVPGYSKKFAKKATQV
jgi:hypothetical protein